jgi:8-oxo-dGTP diphosphatase
MTFTPTSHGNAIDVMLLLTKHDHVLLALRQGTGYADGLWNVPSGKLEAGETVVDAVIREGREEAGLTLSPDDLSLVTVVHHRNPEGHARLGMFFHIDHNPARNGEPVNAEPHKCADLAWFPLHMPPANIVTYTAAGINAFRSQASLALDGWAAPTRSAHGGWMFAPTDH